MRILDPIRCYQCGGSGINRHTGYLCDHCEGSGYTRWSWPLAVLIVGAIVIALAIYGGQVVWKWL